MREPISFISLQNESGGYDATVSEVQTAPAIEALLAPKRALLRESKEEPEEPKKIIRLSDLYFK